MSVAEGLRYILLLGILVPSVLCSRSATINPKYIWKIDRKTGQFILKAGEQQFQTTIAHERVTEMEELIR